MKEEVLDVRDLRVYYHTARGPVKAVDGVSFLLAQGEKMSLVGESGCGKSTAALALLRLIKPPGRIESGEILLDGLNLVALSDEEMRKVRLNKISLVSQGAMNSLNPVARVKDQMMDGMKAHVTMSKQELEERVDQLLEWVGLRREVKGLYPHELSGGMKQRVCIAIAISLKPKVVLADEPTSALDVVVQRQVMQTMDKVQRMLGTSVMLVGHDMGLMAQFAERLGVMYAGKLVELGSVGEVFHEPLHPYTRLLIASLPSLDRRGVLRGIPGLPPALLNPPDGCLFHPRCPHVMPRCSWEVPTLREASPRREVACHLY